MVMRKFVLFLAAIAALAAVGTVTLPRAGQVLALRLAADDPVALADRQLAEHFDAETAAREIEAALAADEVDLAESFLALADERKVKVTNELRARVVEARSARAETIRLATRFGRGFAVGDADGFAGLAGAAAGDLSGYGDFRDLMREGVKFARGESPDKLMVALAGVGVAVTAGTYFSFGAAAPARAGLSVIKVAQRTRRISEGLIASFGRAFRTGRSGDVVAAAAGLGRIESKAGARAAFEGLRHAENLKDVSRLERLASAKGRSTLAILKMLGRGAIVLGAFALSTLGWVVAAAINLYLLIAAIAGAFAALVRRLWPRRRDRPLPVEVTFAAAPARG